ncbi:rhodanese-like domain-containing protein [Solidesulfovibrio sp.]
MNNDAGQALYDKRLFQLKALHEASFELSGLSTPLQIARTFLLTAMGAMGAAKGYLCLPGYVEPIRPTASERPDDSQCQDSRTAPADRADTVPSAGQVGLLLHRGLDACESAKLEAGMQGIARDYFSSSAAFENLPPSRPHLLSIVGKAGATPFPAESQVMVKWLLDGGQAGLLGLGPKIDGMGYLSGEVEFLLNLTDSLLHALSRALLTERLAAMGQDLACRNAELDARVFQLETLAQALSEMSGITDSQPLLSSFLLFMMGASGSRAGYVLLTDTTGQDRRFAGRGINAARVEGAGPEQLRKLVTGGLFRSGGRKTGWVQDQESLAAAGLPALYPGVWFVADEKTFGFVGLGDGLDPEHIDASRRDTLLALTGELRTCLKNVKLLEASRKLNAELTARNQELKETIEEITHCRVEIDGLEKAKARIKALVRREMDRVSLASWTDFVFLLVVSASVGFLFNWANPSGVPLVAEHWVRPATQALAPTQAKALIDAGQAVLVDARPQENFNQQHIAGALNLTPALFDFIYGMRLAKVDPQKTIIVYGRTISSLYDEEVAGRLVKRGHKDVRLLDGGLAGWRNLGFPVRP